MSKLQKQKVTGFARLMASVFYDAMLLIAVLFFATLALLLIPEDFRNASSLSDLAKVGWYLLISYIYFVGFWLKGGQTPGMKPWKLTLVTMQGDPPGLKQATLRFFTAILSWALAGLGFLWMLVDSNHYSLHDHLSGSKLIFKDT
ncbi:MAG: RDD family protein [Gammaproteobacteria bacterium]|nr:RDD family protein [Gammaproteobacteria bacterium]